MLLVETRFMAIGIWTLMFGFQALTAAPIPQFQPKGECHWISGNSVAMGKVRASVGEVILFKFCVYNNEKKQKISAIVRQRLNDVNYVKNGLEVVEAPVFVKSVFDIKEHQSCLMKIKVNTEKIQFLDIIFVGDGLSDNPKDYVCATHIVVNDSRENKRKCLPWDESELCDFSEF